LEPVLAEPFLPTGAWFALPYGLAFLSPRLPSLILFCITSRLCSWDPLPFLALRRLPGWASHPLCLCLAVSALLLPWDFSQPFIARLMKQIYSELKTEIKFFWYFILTRNSQCLLTIVNNSAGKNELIFL